MLAFPLLRSRDADGDFDPIENTRLAVSACPTTDDRLETGTTPAVMIKL